MCFVLWSLNTDTFQTNQDLVSSVIITTTIIIIYHNDWSVTWHLKYVAPTKLIINGKYMTSYNSLYAHILYILYVHYTHIYIYNNLSNNT